MKICMWDNKSVIIIYLTTSKKKKKIYIANLSQLALNFNTILILVYPVYYLNNIDKTITSC